MYGNQGIQFQTPSIALKETCGGAMLICKDFPTSFFMEYNDLQAVTPRVDLVTVDGQMIKTDVVKFASLGRKETLTNDRIIFATLEGIEDYIKDEDCFRLQQVEVTQTDYLSVIRVQLEDLYDDDPAIGNQLPHTFITLPAGKYSVELTAIDTYMEEYTGRPEQGRISRNIKGYVRVQNADDESFIPINVQRNPYDFNSVGKISKTFTLNEETQVYVSILITEDAGDFVPNERTTLYFNCTLAYYSDSKEGTEDRVIGISNILKYTTELAGLVNIKSGCYKDAFGLPYSLCTYDSAKAMYAKQTYLQQVYPIRLFAPQFNQSDGKYEKRNGEVVTLYAKYYKEWQGETDYLSEAMHDKIMAALSCDEVYIDNKRVTKSDNYVIDWENYDLDCDGVTKLAKATFKVRENITQRNPNY